MDNNIIIIKDVPFQHLDWLMTRMAAVSMARREEIDMNLKCTIRNVSRQREELGNSQINLGGMHRCG